VAFVFGEGNRAAAGFGGVTDQRAGPGEVAMAPHRQLASTPSFAYLPNMTSVEIIEEIKRLPRAEQNRVFDFVRQTGAILTLTPDELGELARKMAETRDPVEADRLQTEIVQGFYGGRPNA
jgi:hypothetical protein